MTGSDPKVTEVDGKVVGGFASEIVNINGSHLSIIPSQHSVLRNLQDD